MLDAQVTVRGAAEVPVSRGTSSNCYCRFQQLCCHAGAMALSGLGGYLQIKYAKALVLLLSTRTTFSAADGRSGERGGRRCFSCGLPDGREA